MTTQDIEFGLDSFVPISVDESGRELSGDVVIRNTVEEAVLADAVGIDSFNIAEHYRQDMMDSAAPVIPIFHHRGPHPAHPSRNCGNRTEHPGPGSGLHRIRHPRCGVERAGATHPWSRFADGIVPALRARPQRLRGALRGEPRSADAIAARPTRHVVRQVSLAAHRSVPEPAAPRRTSAHVGWCRRQSSIRWSRLARYGLPLMLAVMGGHSHPIRGAGRALQACARPCGYPQLPIGMHSHGYVARTDQEAVDIQFPHWAHVMGNAAAERGWASPTMDRFQAEIAEGSLYLGSPETVATKIAWVIRLLQAQNRFQAGLCDGACSPRTEDGDHRAVRPRGDSTGERAPGQMRVVRRTPRPSARETVSSGSSGVSAVRVAKAVWASSAPERSALRSPARSHGGAATTAISEAQAQPTASNSSLKYWPPVLTRSPPMRSSVTPTSSSWRCPCTASAPFLTICLRARSSSTP